MDNDEKTTLRVTQGGKGEGHGITYQEKDGVTTITMLRDSGAGGATHSAGFIATSGGGGSIGSNIITPSYGGGGFPARMSDFDPGATLTFKATAGAGGHDIMRNEMGVRTAHITTTITAGGGGSLEGLTGGIPMSITLEEADPKPRRVAIAYNPYSVDSLVGAALALHYPGHEDSRCVPYNPFGSVMALFGYDEIMFVGVEVTKLDFTALITNNPDCILDLICYRDSYVWLTDKIESDNSATVRRFMPGDEMFSELTARTDNTATKVLQFMLDEVSKPIPAFGHNDMLDLVARQVSQSYPIMPMVYDLNEGVDSNTELANKARIHDLVPKLRMALASFSPREEMADIEIVPDVNAYLSHFRHVRYALSRSLHMRAFGRGGVNYALPVSPASELTHGDILHAALQNYDEVLTYEDVGEFRVWRIHSPKVYDRRAIANVFKPLLMWSEGVVLCAVTNLTTYAN